MVYKFDKIKAKVVCYNYKNVRKVDASRILKNVNDVCNRCTLEFRSCAGVFRKLR